MRDINIKALNILICDDSITNVLVLNKLLESEGFKFITTLTDPVKVLPKLHEDTFDLLLLDIEMPTLNGFDVMRKIQQSTIAKQNIPILILTGCEGSEIRNRALTSGAQDFVNKPFDQTEVFSE